MAGFVLLAWGGGPLPPPQADVVELHRGCAEAVEPGHRAFQEYAPRYSVERSERGADARHILNLQLAVPTNALWEAPMVGLACRLATDYSAETGIDALIFDDRKAARHLALGFTDERGYGLYLWHLRAHYELDRIKKRQFMDFLVPSVQDDLLRPKRYRIWISGD